MTATNESKPKELSKFLVLCWSDADSDVLVEIKSYSVYQAADDARHDYPGFAYYDPVRVLQSPSDQNTYLHPDSTIV